MLSRSSGVLLHVTSLPGGFGIGDFGPEATRFLDFLTKAKQRWWQVLPLNPPGYGNSPYQCWSAFAGNPLLISPEMLAEDGLLSEPEIAEAKSAGFGDRVDFGAVASIKPHLIGLAFSRFRPDAGYRHFMEKEREWLDDAVLFAALSDRYEGRPWTEWDSPIARRDRNALDHAAKELKDSIEYHRFAQYIFFRQHALLRAQAKERGIGLIGDIPIFVAHDSADVWAHQELFSLDENGHPTVVAGVPPDYFSSTGQRWGNPLYRWDVLAERGYDWWLNRLQSALGLYDGVRIDHFRGFEAYWEIPASEETAVKGRWVPGPRSGFFEIVKRELDAPIILAEDLGVITAEVEELRDRFDFPGMKVLQFGVGDPESPHLPHNFATTNCVVYTGTHDNDTTLGWWNGLSKEGKKFMREYTGRSSLGRKSKSEAIDEMIRTAMASTAAIAIVPMQDLLCLGPESRMNVPGAATDANWSWRIPADGMRDDVAERMARMVGMYNRG